MGFLKQLLRLLNKLLGRLSKWERKREQEQAQDKRDRAERDPAQYLRDEFGGVRESRSDRDAEEADQAYH